MSHVQEVSYSQYEPRFVWQALSEKIHELSERFTLLMCVSPCLLLFPTLQNHPGLTFKNACEVHLTHENAANFLQMRAVELGVDKKAFWEPKELSDANKCTRFLARETTFRCIIDFFPQNCRKWSFMLYIICLIF